MNKIKLYILNINIIG